MAERRRTEQEQSRQDRADQQETDRIARRAFERFQERGGEHGRDQEDWFEAEQEVRGRAEPAPERVAGDVDARRLEPKR